MRVRHMFVNMTQNKKILINESVIHLEGQCVGFLASSEEVAELKPLP